MSEGVVLDAVIRAPAEAAFAAITDWDGRDLWMVGTRVRVVEGDGRSVGSRIEATAGAGPLAIVDAMVITMWDPPHRIEVEHVGRFVKGRGSAEIHDLPHGMSRVVWTEDFQMPLGRLGRVGWPVVRPGFSVGVRHSLHTFAELVESGVLPRETAWPGR